jgi:hypothetical protein
MKETTINSTYKYIQVESILVRDCDHEIEKWDLINNVITYLNKHYNTNVNCITFNNTRYHKLFEILSEVIIKANKHLCENDFPHHLIYRSTKDGFGKECREIIIEERCKRALNIVSW